MMDMALFEEQLTQLPLYTYSLIDPKELEFSGRIRYICQHECPMYGTTWACPPGVGEVETCRERCLGYKRCLLIGTITEVADISDIAMTLATRPEHEAVTAQVQKLLQEQDITPYVLSSEACAICKRCAYLDGKPCRFPEKMHPCIESHGINIIPTLEKCGLEFQYGDNIVTWYSLLFFND